MHFDVRLTFRLLLTHREVKTNELFKKEFKDHFCFYRHAHLYDSGRETTGKAYKELQKDFDKLRSEVEDRLKNVAR